MSIARPENCLLYYANDCLKMQVFHKYCTLNLSHSIVTFVTFVTVEISSLITPAWSPMPGTMDFRMPWMYQPSVMENTNCCCGALICAFQSVKHPEASVKEQLLLWNVRAHVDTNSNSNEQTSSQASSSTEARAVGGEGAARNRRAPQMWAFNWYLTTVVTTAVLQHRQRLSNQQLNFREHNLKSFWHFVPHDLLTCCPWYLFAICNGRLTALSILVLIWWAQNEKKTKKCICRQSASVGDLRKEYLPFTHRACQVDLLRAFAAEFDDNQEVHQLHH